MASNGDRKDEFYARLSSELEPDVGPVEDVECEARCDDQAVYRVPWPQIGGDVAYCEYHLATYRHDHPDIWGRLQDGPFEDPDEYAVVGDRFVDFEAVPETIHDGEARVVCLDHDGYALYEHRPTDESVLFVRIDRNLDEVDRKEVRRESVPTFFEWFAQTIGWRQLAEDAREVVRG